VPALPVVFTRRAARQVEAAALWWKDNRRAAPNAVCEDLAGTLTLIADQPACGAPTASSRFHGLRRIHLARIDYHLYYRVAPRLRQVQVVAFWHARRGSPPSL
jgi:plasmid stabilization system protein ParE